MKGRLSRPRPANGLRRGKHEISCDSKGVLVQSVLEESPHMPPPINYNFEKRKRENAKKAAKEAKKLRKEAAKANPPAAGDSEAAESPAESAESDTQA